MLDIKNLVTKLAVIAPTGSGKTTIFGSVVKEYRKLNPAKRVVIISHLDLLISQTKKRLKEDWGIENVGILQATDYPHHEDMIVMTTMQSFREESKIQNWARKNVFMSYPSVESLNVGLIIIDEMHFAGCESYQDILSYFPGAIVLGFTATPFRKNKLMTNLFDRVSYTISMGELIKLGFLVEPIIQLTPFDTLNPAEMYSTIIRIYKEKHMGQKAVVYLKTIDEADLCRNIMVDAGIKASSITSMLVGEARNNILDVFRDGEGGADVLTSVDVLTAGFDAPRIRAIFMPYKVSSVTTFLQRVGRGLRPSPGKTHCDIYAACNSPGIEAGFWEKITKQMLRQGCSAKADSYLDDIEFGENDISAEEYRWTQDVVNMANDVKKRGMHGLFEMIVTKRLPPAMLDIFIKSPPLSSQWRTPATEPQIKWLQNWGFSCSPSLTKSEASTLITIKLQSEGRLPPDEFVKTGLHSGKHYSQVPFAYWSIIKRKNPRSTLILDYYNYTRKRQEKINGKQNAKG